MIIYTTDTDFYNGIAELVERGLSFTADAQDLTIVLTGEF